MSVPNPFGELGVCVRTWVHTELQYAYACSLADTYDTEPSEPYETDTCAYDTSLVNVSCLPKGVEPTTLEQLVMAAYATGATGAAGAGAIGATPAQTPPTPLPLPTFAAQCELAAPVLHVLHLITHQMYFALASFCSLPISSRLSPSLFFIQFIFSLLLELGGPQGIRGHLLLFPHILEMPPCI